MNVMHSDTDCHGVEDDQNQVAPRDPKQIDLVGDKAPTQEAAGGKRTQPTRRHTTLLRITNTIEDICVKNREKVNLSYLFLTNNVGNEGRIGRHDHIVGERQEEKGKGKGAQ